MSQRYTVMFGLTPSQVAKARAFEDECLTKLAADPDHKKWCEENGHIPPYLGAIGGGLTYQFTPTGLGIVEEVVFCKGTQWEATLNITDYEGW